MSSSIDLSSMIMGTADMMSSNLTSLGDDVLEKRKTETANAYNMHLWNLQNAYNDPSAQMQRLKNAGLNPNLMYPSGSSGNAGPLQPYNRPPQSKDKKFNMLDTYMSSQQASLIPYQRDLAKQQIKNQIIQEKILNEDLRKKLLANDYFEDVQFYNKGKLISEYEKGLYSAENEYIKQSINDNQIEIQGLQKQLISSQIDMNKYELELNKMGLSKKDPVVYRMMKEVIERMMLNE